MKRACSGAVLRAALAAALVGLPAFGSLQPPPASPPPVPEADRAQVLQDLAEWHGIRVAGAYDAQDLAHVRVVAQLFRETETRGLTFEFKPERRAWGRLGEWRETGVATIASRRLDTVIHEAAHHVLEYHENRRTRLVDTLLVRAVDERCVTRPYALERRHAGDHGELHAELVTALALERLGYAVGGTVENPEFDPPPKVKELVASLFRGG